MASLAIRLDDASSADPFVAMNIGFLVTIQGLDGTFRSNIWLPWDMPAADINDAIRSAAISIAADHGKTVGPSDTVRLFGLALPNLS